MKRIRKAIIAFVILFIITELIARFALGLGEVPVYIEDKDYEYIFAPSQDVKRLGNRIITNELSMRSKPLSKRDRLRILKLGDSVINGGSQTTHDSLASTILEKRLSGAFHDSIRVLNVSANSWGPDNAFAYLKKHENIQPSMLVLVFSSHDLYDNMHFQKVVGVHPAWPSEQPLTATSDALFKYAVPWLRRKLDKNYNEYSYLGEFANVVKLNTGWKEFIDFAKQEELPLLVYLHASKQEALRGQYDDNGQRIINMLDSAEVSCIQGIKYMLDESFYRDNVHPNEKGQKAIAEALYPFLAKHVKERLYETD